MNQFNIRPEDWIRARDMYSRPKRLEPKIDPIATEIVGQKVLLTDPRLLKTVAKFKAMKNDEDAPDNFTQNPKFRDALKKAFDKPL